MPLSDPFDNTPPVAKTPDTGPFDNTAPVAGSPGQAAAFDNTSPGAGTPGQAAAFDNTRPELNKTTPTKMYPAKAGSGSNINIGTWTTATAIDTVTVVEGDSVLLKGQTAPAENGLYIVAASQLRRHPDFDSTDDFNFAVCLVVVAQGVTQTGPWMLSTPAPITLGSTGLTFASLTGYGRQFQNDDQPEAKGRIKVVTGINAASTANVNLAVTLDAITLDGYGLSPGVLVLLKNQTAPAENGIYLVNVGVATRYTIADHQSEFEGGLDVFVLFGDTQSGTLWTLTTPPPINLGSTPLVFAQKIAAPKTATAAFDNNAPVAGTPGGAAAFDNTSPVASSPGAAFDNTSPVAGTPGGSTAFDNTAPAAGTPSSGAFLFPCAAVFETNWNLATTLEGVIKDGYQLVTTEAVLLMGQTNAVQNGIYVVNVGAPTRHTSYDTTGEFTARHWGAQLSEGTRIGTIFYWHSMTPFTLGISNVYFVEDKAVPMAV
jgi:hypothetical protein